MIFVFDLDDTLLRSDKSISEYTKYILKQCHIRGDKIIIDTARDYYNTSEVAKLIEADYVIVNGGAQIYSNTECIYSDLISAREVFEITSEIINNPEFIGLTVQADYAYTKDLEYAQKRIDARFFDFNKPFTKDASKIIVSTKNESLVKELADKYNLNLIRYYNGDWYRLSKTSKATGLKVLLNMLNEEGNEQDIKSVAFGDDSGDIQMLKMADVGVALKNSSPQVLEAISEVTDYSCDEDGCADYIAKKYLYPNLKLVKLSYDYKKHLSDMLNEWLDVEQRFSPYAIRKNDYRDFDYYLEHLEVKNEKDGLVPDSTFFCLDTDRDIFVGAVNIRHYLGPYNCHTGGHIGDGIRPSERRKGYATAMIHLALLECRKLGMNKVLMTCDSDNYGSAKSIIYNGGVLEREIMEDGDLEQRYWITLGEDIIETDRLIMKRRMPMDAYEAYQGWASDERIMTYMIGGVANSADDMLYSFDNYDPNSKTRYIYIARSKEDGHAVGIIGCNNDTIRPGYELSWLVRYDDQNKGYCTEMASALMDYLRKNGVNDFWSECADKNAASRKVMNKLGLQPCEKSSYSKKDGTITFESTIYRSFN